MPAAAYPSRWHVADHHWVDENDVDLGIPKGFNWNCLGTGLPFAQSVFDETAALIATAAVAGPPLLRHVLTWDTMEPTAGAFDGISTPLGAATAGSSFDKLDVSIQRAYAAGCYVYLDIHLLDPSSSGGRVPTWAKTGTLPSGSGNSWTWYITNGQAFTETLAQRYGDPATSPIGAAAKAVVGLSPNEPPASSLSQIMSGFQTLVPWWKAYAPLWPVWISPTSYGGGTPYPSGAADIDVAALLALDTENVGIGVDWHDYLVNVGSASADGYQSNGAIGPVEQVTNGAEFYGWGTAYLYANTSASRTAFAAHMAPLVTLRDEDPSICVNLIEWGSDNPSDPNHDAYVLDKINAARAAGFASEVWWQKGFGTTGFDSNYPAADDSYRPAISGTPWMLNATARAAGAAAVSTVPPTVVGAGALGVTPNNATASMSATGMTLPAGVAENDLLLMFVYFDTGATTSGQSITNPAGWSTLLDLPHLTNGNMWRVLYRVAGASETDPPSPTFVGATTGTSGGTGLCRVIAYRGVDVSSAPTSCLAGSSGGNGFTNQQNLGAMAGFTPTADDVLVVVFAGKKDDWTSVATLSGDSLTWTEDFESVSTNAGDAGIVVDSAPVVGAPVAISNKTFTVTGGATANGLGRMFALKPAAAAPAASGAADVSGGGAVTAVGAKQASGAAGVAGGGTVAAVGRRGASSSAVVSGGGSVVAVGRKGAQGTAGVSGGGVVTAVGTAAEPVPAGSGAASVSGGGVVQALGVKAASGSVAVSGGGGVATAGVAAVAGMGSALVSGGGVVVAAGFKAAAAAVAVSGGGAVSVNGMRVVAPEVAELVSPVFDAGSVVDLVRWSLANARPWAHERRVFHPGHGRVVVSVRPAQTPVQSVVADAYGVARFAVPSDGRYWFIGERGGVVRRVARSVP